MRSFCLSWIWLLHTGIKNPWAAEAIVNIINYELQKNKLQPPYINLIGFRVGSVFPAFAGARLMCQEKNPPDAHAGNFRVYCLHYNIQTVSVCRSQLTDAVTHTKCYVIINILCQLVKADETAATDSSASLTYMLFMLFCLRSFRLIVLFCGFGFVFCDDWFSSRSHLSAQKSYIDKHPKQIYS